MWTEFWDMHSGGSQKEQFSNCYIEADEETAIRVFFARFGHNPKRISCTCCGEDYAISTSDSLEEATGYHRNCAYDRKTNTYVEKPRESGYKPYMTLPEYLESSNVCVIYTKDITQEEKTLVVPEQGYVWR